MYKLLLIFLQKNITDLERIRESLAKELVNLATKIENLEIQANLYPDLNERLIVSIFRH